MQAAYNQLIADYPMLATPSITASAYMRKRQSVSWSTASGYNVSYAVRVDGALRSTASAPATRSLSRRWPTHHLDPATSTRNWNTTSTAQTTLTVDATAPLPSGFDPRHDISWSVARAVPTRSRRMSTPPHQRQPSAFPRCPRSRGRRTRCTSTPLTLPGNSSAGSRGTSRSVAAGGAERCSHRRRVGDSLGRP